MHSIVFVLLPPDTTDILGRTETLFAVFDLNLELPPYKEYLSKGEIDHWAKKLGTSDLETIAVRLTKGGAKTGLDENGLYEMSTFNRRGRFDSWVPARVFEENPLSTKAGGERDGRRLNRSICRVSDLPPDEKSLPFAIVTPEGEWFCATDFGVVPLHDFQGRSELNRDAQAKWNKAALTLLAKYLDHFVLALDVHS